MNEITVSKISPVAGDIFIIGVHPGTPPDAVECLLDKFNNYLIPRLACKIVVPGDIRIERLSGETAQWLAEEILKKAKPQAGEITGGEK